MKRILKLSGIAMLIVVLMCNTVNAESFDKNDIISDVEFESYASMNQNEIQSFLESRGSALASYQTERAWNITTNSWGDLTIIPASQIIYEASIDNNINPMVILTMLQKEQSLIESGNLNGVDIACGYAPGDTNYQGFGKQVWSCAWQLRVFFDNAIVGSEFIATDDGNLIVYPSNRATYALYKYNPSIGDPYDETSEQGGNYNFWLIWNNYFSIDIVDVTNINLNVPVYKQGSPSPWCDDQLGGGDCSETIGSAGCAITSIAMVFKYYGVQTDPGNLNDWLKQNNGYYNDGCLVLWPVAAGRSDGTVQWAGSDYTGLNQINSELDNGYPVIAKVSLFDSSHFVVITGYSGSTYFINDPYYGDQSTINDRYGDPASAILGIRFYHGTAAGTSIPISGDLNGDGKVFSDDDDITNSSNEVGIFNPSTNEFTFGGKTVIFGMLGDLPIMGDWDHDGKDEIGIYRPDEGGQSMFCLVIRDWDTLQPDANVGNADYDIPFGPYPDNVPIAGDWDGDGDDDIGGFNPGNNKFYLYQLNLESESATSYKDVPFGVSGDKPIIGDWDGDNDDDVGVYREHDPEYNNNLVFYFDLDLSGVQSDLTPVPFGDNLDVGVIGDWDNDGDDNIGVYRPSTNQFCTDPNKPILPDTTNPTIFISSPTNGQTVTTSTIVVSGSANDDVALSKVEVKVGAENWQLASETTSWSKTVTLASGSNTIYALATDTSGNIMDTSVTITYTPPSTSNQPPTAIIDSITPNPAEQVTDTITFTGHGTDSDGSVTACNWMSSIDGQLSTSNSFSMQASDLSVGTHTIYYKVQDNDGAWSTDDTEILTINSFGQPVITVDDDGPADYNTIQAAVDAASTGDTIYVYNGRYRENIIISKSLTLLGQNEDNVIIDGDRSGNCIKLSYSNVIVNGFTITNASGYGIYALYSNLEIENVAITDNTNQGIYFYYGKTFTIRNSTINGNGGGIIYGYAATGDAVVEDNIITNNIGSGVSISLIEGKSATVVNNKIDNNAGSSSDGIRVSIAGTGGLMTIENNPVTKSGRHGIYLSGVRDGSSVSDFSVKNSGSYGLYALYSNLEIENVTITDNTNQGIYFYYGKTFTIRNSTINGNGGGIIYGYAATGDAVVEDNIITNNIGSGVSISLIEGKSATVANNKIDNNAGSSSDGIRVSIAGTGGLMTIENNPVTRSGRYGIYLRGIRTDSTVANFSVESSGSYGLYAVSSDLDIENVTIIDNTNLGIYFYSGKGFTLRNSTINGNGGGIIYGGNYATDDAVVENNIITNNIGSGVSISLIEGKSVTVANNKIDNNAGSSSDGIYVSIAGSGGLMTIENNPVTQSGRYGIYLRGVKTGSTVANFNVESSGSYGLYSVSSDLNLENVTITDNTNKGIYFYSGKAFTLRNSTINGNGGGIIYGGNAAIGDAVVENNIITNNIGSGVLINLVEGKSATVANNKIDINAGSSSDGIYVSIAGLGGPVTIENNPVTKSGRYGIYLRGVKTGSTVANFNVESSGSYGLYAVSSDLNLENVTITDNINKGIYFYSGKAFTLRNSTINGNGGGIIYGGNAATGDAVVEDNIITNNIGSGVSISLIEGKSATVANNKIDNNAGASSNGMYVGIAGTGGIMNIQNNPVSNSGSHGIYLSGVKSGSTIKDFTVQNSGSDGLRADYSDLNLENVTTINNFGRGIYFVHGKGFAVHDSKIDGNAGGIIYGGNAGTGDAVVEDTIITNNVGSGVSLTLAQDKSATIKNNIINNNAGSLSDGIYVNIAGTGGVSTIENNSVQNSGRYGMYLTKVVNSAFVNNNVSNNLYGFNLYLSSNNLIHHNIFIDNSNYNANDNTGTNSWDYGYPDGGNYWGDYAGVDNNKGPNQDELGSDGIGDTQYDISGGAGANDSYPLMSVTQNPTTYTISVSTSPSGLIPQPLGGGTYNSGQTATVTAQSVTGYTFRNWTENSNQVSTSASYPFTVTGDRNLVAVYTNTDGIVGDINDDNVVNYIDLGILGASYGLSLGEVGYNAAADLNGDGIVNYIDLGMLGANYGNTS